MLAGAVLLAVVWVFLLRYVAAPEASILRVSQPTSELLRAFAPIAAAVLAFLLVFGLVGGWLLAGRMLAPLTRITDATRVAAAGSLSHRIALEGRNDEFRELADAFDTMLARLEAHVAEQQRFAANASHELRTPLAITQTLLDVARNDPNRDTGELVDRLHAVNTRAIDLTEALLLLSRADQRSFTREQVDLSLVAEEAAETLLPLAEKRGLTIETSGDVAPTDRLARAAAAADDEPRAQRDRPQPARGRHACGSRPAFTRARGAHRREHRRAAHPTARSPRWPSRSSAAPTDPRGPRRRRPRPRDRQEHHPGTRGTLQLAARPAGGLRVTVQLPAAVAPS